MKETLSQRTEKVLERITDRDYVPGAHVGEVVALIKEIVSERTAECAAIAKAYADEAKRQQAMAGIPEVDYYYYQGYGGVATIIETKIRELGATKPR